MYKDGLTAYLTDLGNYADMTYIWCSVINVILQNMGQGQEFHTKIIVTVIIWVQIAKTFFFLRIFEELSYIVSMILNVICDLRRFLLFFVILIILFSQCVAVLGLANPRFQGQYQRWYDSEHEDDD